MDGFQEHGRYLGVSQAPLTGVPVLWEDSWRTILKPHFNYKARKSVLLRRMYNLYDFLRTKLLALMPRGAPGACHPLLCRVQSEEPYWVPGHLRDTEGNNVDHELLQGWAAHPGTSGSLVGTVDLPT